MHTEALKWGILGTASIAKRAIIPGIAASESGEVVAIASRSLEKAQAFAAEHDIKTAYGSY
ncbi:oxidoreductase, partial [Virgibacillus sp. 7505]